MKTMKMSFPFTEMGHEKGKIPIFHVIFLNKDIFIIVADIILKFRMLFLHMLPEGSVSQISYLGPSFYFMQP